MIQSHGRAYFHTEMTSTIEKGKDRKEARVHKAYAEDQGMCSSREHHHVCDLSVGSTSHRHIIS